MGQSSAVMVNADEPTSLSVTTTGSGLSLLPGPGFVIVNVLVAAVPAFNVAKLYRSFVLGDQLRR